MEPCMMCCGAIIQSRIKKIVFIVENPNYGCIHLLKNSKIIVIKEKNDKEIKKMLKPQNEVYMGMKAVPVKDISEIEAEPLATSKFAPDAVDV